MLNNRNKNVTFESENVATRKRLNWVDDAQTAIMRTVITLNDQCYSIMLNVYSMHMFQKAVTAFWNMCMKNENRAHVHVHGWKSKKSVTG